MTRVTHVMIRMIDVNVIRVMGMAQHSPVCCHRHWPFPLAAVAGLALINVLGGCNPQRAGLAAGYEAALMLPALQQLTTREPIR
jgi:hypothetical protein